MSEQPAKKNLVNNGQSAKKTSKTASVVKQTPSTKAEKK